MNTDDIPAQTEDARADDWLDAGELRVLAVLAEKEALTPDSYPLSLNALTNGCNQLSSRDPVMTMSESDVQQTLPRLIGEKFVTEVNQAGARVTKVRAQAAGEMVAGTGQAGRSGDSDVAWCTDYWRDSHT
jgi:uncharacterized protein YceH (UPF0502 family)